MAAFAEEQPRTPAAMSYIRNQAVGSGEAPYVYITRRTYDQPGGAVTLTCMGGPEWPHDGIYDPWAPFPGALLDVLDSEVRALRAARAARRTAIRLPLARADGLHGRHGARHRPAPPRPSLLYNLGCNGVGFLPSIHGGRQIARLLGGEQLPPSIFDPR